MIKLPGYLILKRRGIKLTSITKNMIQKAGMIFFIVVFGICNSVSQCPSISFNLTNYNTCCYSVQLDNTSECTPQLTMLLDIGQFSSWTVDAANGFSANLITQNELLISHSSGSLPIGLSTPIEFCTDGPSPPTLSMLYDFVCGIGESCSANIPLIACSTPDSCNAVFEFVINNNCGLFQFNDFSIGQLPLTYLWNFDDPNSGVANTSTFQNPAHQFSELCRNYNVCLTITGADNCTHTICLEIVVFELEPPVITCPVDILLNCSDGISPDDTGYATATDNCELNPQITFSDDEAGSFPCEYEIIRSWSVTDQCGHESMCEQLITVLDDVPPVITCPNDLTVNASLIDSCNSIVNSLQLTSVNDACSNVQISYQVNGATSAQGQQNVSGLVFNVGVSTVTYTVTDECGNSSSCSFDVTVICESGCSGNLVQNSGFSDGIVGGTMPIGKVTDWKKGYGNPLVVNAFGCEDNGYIQLSGNKISGDAIVQELVTPIKKGQVYEMSICVRAKQGSIPYVKIRAMAFNGSLPSIGNHPLPSSDHAIIDVSGRIAACNDWTTFVFHRWHAPQDFDNLVVSVENSEHFALNLMSVAEVDNICFYPVNDSIPCYLVQFDSLGNLTSPLGEIDTTCLVLEDSVDIFMGNVNDIYAYCDPAPNNMDTWYEFCLDSCESIGGEIPIELDNFIQNDSMDQLFQDSLGVSVAEFQSDINNFIDSLELVNPGVDLINDMNSLGPILFDCRSLPPQGSPPDDTLSPFKGRDIIFVHGLRMGPILERLHQSTPGSQSVWPDDRPEFYSGYWKSGAYKTWNHHTEKYLKTTVDTNTFNVNRTGSYSNRYIVVSHPATQSFIYGAHSILEQIANAMIGGVGVINCNLLETRPANTFGHNGFIMISHSDGAPLTDIVLTTSDLSRYPPLNMTLGDLSFIADRCELHVGLQGAFGGSDYASALLMAASTGLQYVKPIAEEFLGGPITSSSAFLFTSELLDMAITRQLWAPVLDNVPVCVLTIAGGHPTDYGEEIGAKHTRWKSILSKNGIHQGFDDGVLSIESQSANPDPRLVNPNVFLPYPGILGSITLNEKLFDMGIPKERAIRYYMDQKVDLITKGDPTKLPFASAGSVPWISPTGMVQPVKAYFKDVPGFDALKRYKNHYSFLQSTSDHYQGSRGQYENYPNYEQTYDAGSNNGEESRVVTSSDVYTKCGVNASRLKQVEYVRGKSITFGFKLFGKRYRYTRWIWKRKYHVLENHGTWNQLDYLYYSVFK